MVQFSENTEDRIVWRDIKAGDKTQFNRLFRKYYSELYYYGFKIFSNPDFVKECIQEVFIRIWETRKSLAEVENIKSYLIVSLRRKILTQKEKVMRTQNIEVSQVKNSPFFFEENEFEKHEEISDETRQILLSAINSLTKKQRELVILFFYHGFPYPDIAQVMGISIQAARNLMYRTLSHLRQSLGEKSIKTTSNLFFMLFSARTKRIDKKSEII